MSLNPNLVGALGIIQGRLSPRPPHRIQAFPSATWRAELDAAREIGFDFIEWIYEADQAAENPLVSSGGRSAIRKAIRESGTPVRSVCVDYFMEHRLSDPESAGLAAARHLSEVVKMAQDIGAVRILLPWLEGSCLDTAEKTDAAVRNLHLAARVAEDLGVMIGLEMEIEGPKYRDLVERIQHPAVGVYYDAGNSTAAGFDVKTDILAVLPYLIAVHLKDRKMKGGTVPFGEGHTNFSGLFEELIRAQYRGDFVCQHAFSNHRADAMHAHGFVKRVIESRAAA